MHTYLIRKLTTSRILCQESGENNFTIHEFHFLLQVFPGTLLPHNYANPQNPDHLLARSEVERRRDYIQPLHGQLGEEHPLVQLVHQCLHNTPARRPSAEELLQQLEAVRAQIEGPYGSQLKKVDVVKVGMMKALREIESLQEQVHQLEEVHEYVLFHVQLSCFYNNYDLIITLHYDLHDLMHSPWMLVGTGCW